MTPFIGEIMAFGGNFAPRGWAFCNGQLLPIAENTALFSILGTTYGGDGSTTFRLPELRGRIPMHAGSSPGLSPRPLGQKSGLEENYLNILTMAAHTHFAQVGGDIKIPVSAVKVNEGGSPSDSPNGAYLTAQDDDFYQGSPSANEFSGAPVNQITVTNTNTGANQGINNIAPYQCINYIIAMQGTFPSRS